MIGGMSKSTPHIALMQAQDLPTADAGTAPEWIHLIPAGVEIMTQDNRGPYRVVDPQSVVASLKPGEKLPIDENHAIDWAAPRGEPSPARGYIVELQARNDGIWGRVDWTEAGRSLMADRAYLGISPAIVHDGAKAILGVARASLTNKPNLRGLTSLHMETDDMSLVAVAKALSLSDDASEDQILSAIGNLTKPAETETALQSQMGEIGVALGVAKDAAPEAILAAAKTKTAATPEEIVALQTELAGLATEMNALKETRAREMAEAFVDGEIKRGRYPVKPMRDHYIAMHMQDPDRVEKEITAFPIMDKGKTVLPAQPTAKGEVALQSEQLEAARLLGIDPKDYAAAMAAETKEAN